MATPSDDRLRRSVERGMLQALEPLGFRIADAAVAQRGATVTLARRGHGCRGIDPPSRQRATAFPTARQRHNNARRTWPATQSGRPAASARPVATTRRVEREVSTVGSRHSGRRPPTRTDNTAQVAIPSAPPRPLRQNSCGFGRGPRAVLPGGRSCNSRARLVHVVTDEHERSEIRCRATPSFSSGR
jgi:hypothetical protein